MNSASSWAFNPGGEAVRRIRRARSQETPAVVMSTATVLRHFESHCEDEFQYLAEHAPLRLLHLVQTGLRARPDLLTFAAEAMARIAHTPLAVMALLPLLHSEHAIVREGAVYGLMPHLRHSMEARTALRDLAGRDASPGVRSAAEDALANLD